MPWNFPWTEFLKKRACRYILQHYLGHFLKEKLTLDQLSVDLYNGTGKIKELELDVESLNEALDSSNVPLEIVDGFVEEISVAIPWTRLIQNSTELEIHGLQLTLQPKQRKEHVSGLEVMFNSMSSMNTSLQIAEDCLKSAKSEEEPDVDMGQPYEGVQKFAQTIDSVLCRVKVTLVDTIIRIEHLPVNSDKGVALEIRIKRMEYYDDMAKEEGSPVDDPERANLWEPAAIAHKNIVLEGVQLLSDQFSRHCRQGDSPVDSPCSTPQTFMSTVSSLSPESFDKTPTVSQETLTDPVQIAVLTGRTGLKLKIKQGEAIQGPKIETDLDIGGLHLLLSPQQFHGLLDLIEGLMSPDTNDGTSKKGRGNKNKPMSPDDYKKVETELQRHLASGRVQQQQQRFLQTQYMGMGMQDIMTQSIGEVEDDQYFSLAPDKMREMQSSVNSNYSMSSQRTTSTVTTTRQGQRKESRSSKDTMQRILDDPSAELCRYHFRLAFFSLCLLHENPSQRVQLASPSKGHKSSTKMRDISAEYFQNVFSFTAAGKSDLKALRSRFSDVLQVDHLRFVGKPLNIDCTEKTVTTHQSLTLDLTLGLFECLECLYNRTTDNAVPEYTELLVFPRDGSDKPSQMYSSMHVGSPAIKASIKTVEQIRGQQRMGNHPRTEVSVSLGKLECEVDLTIVDRVNSLVKPEPLQRTLSNNSQTIHADTFSQTLEEGSLTQDKKYDLSVSTSQAKVTLRIPIPDLRAVSEVGKLPWWQKNLRDEILVFDIQELRFQTAFLSSQSLQHLEFSCKELEGSFRIDPNQSPVPFATVSCEGDSEDGFNLPQLLIKFSEKKISVLEEEIEDSGGDTPQDSLNGACEFSKKDPSPFSNRKYMYGKEEMSEKDHTATHISHEMVLPGDRDEMSQFQEKACNNCLMNVDIILPRVNLFIPNKHFYEVLYNRLNNDLLLWEPMAPAPIATTSNGGNTIQPFDLSCYTQVLQDNFSMARSALQYESSSDEEDLYAPHYSIHDSRHPRQKQGRLKLPSKLCLSLRIDSGKLTAYTESKETGCHGETVAMVNDANLFVVSHYTGDPCLQYVCFRSASAELYHSGAVSDSHKVMSMMQLDIDHIPPHLTSHRLISRSEPGIQAHQSTDSSMYMDNTDMVSVAVRVRLDSTPITDLTTDEKIKEFLVAVGISGGTLRHKMAASGQSWIAHFINFLDVKDYDILGYVMPKVLTELHVHLWSCAVDYRPLYIPTKAVLAAESFSISSNIVANSPTSLLRFVLDDAALYLSQKRERDEINISEDYVNIIDLERFELELRSSEGKDQRFPKTDLRVMTNKINLRTCSDSCQALMELIQYFATDGDLVAEGDVTSSIPGDDIVPDLGNKKETEESSREDDSSGLSEPSLSQSKIDQLHTLVEDAMQESSSGSENQDSLSPTRPSTEVFFVANTNQKSQDAPPAGVMRPIVISASADSVTSSTMSETVDALSDDEEFCIIDDPGLGIMPKHGEPEIRVFTTDPIEIKENHFSQPLGRTDLLKAPDHFPYPEYSYTLKELTIVWFMYGGRDFGDVSERTDKEAMQVRKTSDAGDYQFDVAWQYMTSAARASLSHDRIPWQIRGGPGRDLDTLMELQLTKVRMQYDIYPSHTEQASRQVLVVNDIEMRDRLANSNINKFLYQYSSENLPKQTHANMVVIKAVHSRPDLSVKSQECALRVSLQPIRLNIDQDSLYFLTRFFTEIVGGTVETSPEVHSDLEKDGKGKPRSRSSSGTTGPAVPPPVMKMGQPVSPIGESETQEPLMMFDDMQDSVEPGEITVEEPSVRLEDDDHVEQESETLPVFIKSFVFSPDVPIRLDYHGKKWVDREKGTFIGLLVGLAQLNCSELKLKRLSYKHGLLGIDKVQAYCVNEWVNDILKNQLPSILGGVGPMHSFVQLAQGIKDLFWLPVEQYKRDGRLVRGIQRGATSFSTSTAMAMLELTNRAVQSVQYVAEVTYDVVTPGPSIRLQRRRLRGQPSDIREGMENAYIAIREGFSCTAHNIVDVTKKEHEQKGFTGAMGAAFRLVPPTVISPVIIAADATSNVLGGMRNQLKPDAKKEDDEKWKANQT